MNATFLAVVIIMALLVLFVLVILQSLAGSAGVRIRADMVKLLETYDTIIERKSGEIRSLQAAAEKLHVGAVGAKPVGAAMQTPQSTGHVSLPQAAYYRSKAFGGDYNAVQARFRFNEEECAEIVAQVTQIAAARAPSRGDAAAKLRRALSFDTVYRLSKMRGEQQLEVLDASLDDEGWALLRDFCEEQAGRVFEIGRFCCRLAELEALESCEISVRCGGVSRMSEEDVERAPGICEGIQIVTGGRLYDYSIQEREIG